MTVGSVIDQVNRPVRFAIVGCGVIADIHAQGIVANDETELVAVCDHQTERGQAFAERYGARFYASYEEMLADPAIDVVSICTPSGLHPQQTIAAARAGKHVLCEKPIGIDRDSVAEMIDVCREQGVLLSTVFPRRVSPAAQYLRQQIAAGALGRITLVEANMKIYRSQGYYDSAGWRGTWAMDGGGAMMNQGIHWIDLLQWLVGGVSSVYGRAAALQRDIEVEDTAVAVLGLRSGGMGTIVMTTTGSPEQPQRIEIQGEHGSAILTEDTITRLHIRGEDVQVPAFEPFQVLPDGHRLLIRDMALAVLEQRSPGITGEDGVQALELIWATYESSRTGRTIEIA